MTRSYTKPSRYKQNPILMVKIPHPSVRFHNILKQPKPYHGNPNQAKNNLPTEISQSISEILYPDNCALVLKMEQNWNSISS